VTARGGVCFANQTLLRRRESPTTQKKRAENAFLTSFLAVLVIHNTRERHAQKERDREKKQRVRGEELCVPRKNARLLKRKTMTAATETPLRANEDAMKQIMQRVFEEIKPFVAKHEPDVPEEDLPELSRTRDLSKADFTVQWSRFCAKRKLNPAEYVKNLSETIQKQIEDGGENQDGFIKSVQGVGPYMNIFVKRQKVFKLAINAIIDQGAKYGCTNAGQGKRVIIEHTSSNPNAPLHIGNLRNVMIGAHLARVMQACGCEVTQAFYVNDLGAQIGLTALAYSRIYTKIKPTMKIDQWIGAMYAVMNTCQELQQVGVQPGDVEVRFLFFSIFSFIHSAFFFLRHRISFVLFLRATITSNEADDYRLLFNSLADYYEETIKITSDNMMLYSCVDVVNKLFITALAFQRLTYILRFFSLSYSLFILVYRTRAKPAKTP
jgi:hypothetical protein